MAPRLEAARQEVLDDLELFGIRAGRCPTEKQPLDAAFIDLPERLLDEYQAKAGPQRGGPHPGDRPAAREEVDRVVVLGIGGSYMGAGRCSRPAAIRTTTS